MADERVDNNVLGGLSPPCWLRAPGREVSVRPHGRRGRQPGKPRPECLGYLKQTAYLPERFGMVVDADIDCPVGESAVSCLFLHNEDRSGLLAARISSLSFTREQRSIEPVGKGSRCLHECFFHRGYDGFSSEYISLYGIVFTLATTRPIHATIPRIGDGCTVSRNNSNLTPLRLRIRSEKYPERFFRCCPLFQQIQTPPAETCIGI